MARKPSGVSRQPGVATAAPPVAPIAAMTPIDQQNVAPSGQTAPESIGNETPVAGSDTAVAPIGAGLVRWLQMETGLSGPDFCLSRRDKHLFSDTPAADGGPSEAQRLVDAGFAVDCDPPAEA